MNQEAERLVPPPTLEAKVAFLRSPASYPECPAQVDAIETHMSWVFVTDAHAYKLKKPIQRGPLDYGTLYQRLVNCRREVELNRRLAPRVYLGVVPLTLGETGGLHLGEDGVPVEWLVKMRRLPEERTLRRAIEARQFDRTAIQGAAAYLAAFFRDAPALPMQPADYRARFVGVITQTKAELARGKYGLDLDVLDRLAAMLLGCLDDDSGLVAQRGQRVIEGHGDLRPEHIHLAAEPLVTDCLEFDRALRLLDPLDELAFLALECERLGAPAVGAQFIAAYRDAAGDPFASGLVDFYAACNAWVRAHLAIWHLDEPGRNDGAKWRERAARYLALGSAHASRLEYQSSA